MFEQQSRKREHRITHAHAPTHTPPTHPHTHAPYTPATTCLRHVGHTTVLGSLQQVQGIVGGQRVSDVGSDEGVQSLNPELSPGPQQGSRVVGINSHGGGSAVDVLGGLTGVGHRNNGGGLSSGKAKGNIERTSTRPR